MTAFRDLNSALEVIMTSPKLLDVTVKGQQQQKNLESSTVSSSEINLKSSFHKLS